eukprot:PhF_6_TR10708/c0_g1_i1/m.17268
MGCCTSLNAKQQPKPQQQQQQQQNNASSPDPHHQTQFNQPPPSQAFTPNAIVEQQDLFVVNNNNNNNQKKGGWNRVRQFVRNDWVKFCFMFPSLNAVQIRKVVLEAGATKKSEKDIVAELKSMEAKTSQRNPIIPLASFRVTDDKLSEWTRQNSESRFADNQPIHGEGEGDDLTLTGEEILATEAEKQKELERLFCFDVDGTDDVLAGAEDLRATEGYWDSRHFTGFFADAFITNTEMEGGPIYLQPFID